MTKQHKPKGIVIVEDGEDYKLYKVWPGGKRGNEPFLITSDLEELVVEYQKACERWNIRPDLKLVNNIINKHNDQNKEVPQNDTDLFKSMFS